MTNDTDNKELIVQRILTAVVAEAKRIVAEGVATPEDVDTAMRFGALFKKPPFEYEKEVGTDAMRARLDAFAAAHGEQFRV